MKTLAFTFLAAGYLVILSENDPSQTRLIVAMILFAVAFMAGLQVSKTELGKK